MRLQSGSNLRSSSPVECLGNVLKLAVTAYVQILTYTVYHNFSILSAVNFCSLSGDIKQFKKNSIRMWEESVKMDLTEIGQVGIGQSVYRLGTGWTTKGSEFDSRWGQGFSLLHVVQTGSGVHLTYYPTDTGVSFPGVKAA
jgi:hypothetical protein